MTSNNHRLDRTEIHRIFEDGRQQAIVLEARMQALVNKVLEMRSEIEDGRTYRVTLHLGRRQDVKADLEKRY